MQLVLASTSAYRRELLQRLGLPFATASPHVDEAALENENPAATALRLAAAKACAVASSWPAALIIGSDQVAELEHRPLGKPGTRQRALEQLQQMSGQTVRFHTAVALLNTASGTLQQDCILTTVRFRVLSTDEIERYVDREQAFDCAGSAKAEGLGISLLAALSGDDPTALIGLPLITLATMLRCAGLAVP